MVSSKDRDSHIWLGIPYPIWFAIIAAVATTVQAVMVERAKQSVDAASQKAETAVIQTKKDIITETKKTDQKLDDLTKTGESTHTLVNSAMQAALKITAETARSKADVTDDPADVKAAEIAEQTLEDHIDASDSKKKEK